MRESLRVLTRFDGTVTIWIFQNAVERFWKVVLLISGVLLLFDSAVVLADL